MSGAGIHQGKLHPPRSIGAPDGPVAALRFAAESFRDTQDDAGDYQDKTDDSFQVHGTSSSPYFQRDSQNVRVLERHQLVQSQILKPVLSRLLDELRRNP